MNSTLGGDEKGHALVELAIVLPILVIVSFIGIEMSRSIQFSTASVTFSREIASLAFRNCAGETLTSADAMVRTQLCIEAERARIEAVAREAFPGTELIVSFIAYDDTTSKFNLVSAQGVSPAHTSTIAVGLGGSTVNGGLDNDVIKKHKLVVVGEAYVPYQSVVGTIGTFTYDPTVFHERTVM